MALACAVVYTVSSLFLKGAIERGATGAQLNCAVNLAMALITQPLWFFDRPEIPNAPLWQPAVCCVFLFAGQFFTFAALSRGDVSVATPLLGTKIVLVTAINALVFGVPVSARWWVAAFIASVSIGLIAGSAPRGKARNVAVTAFFSLSAAASYSLTDVLIQHWSGSFDSVAFLPIVFTGVGLLSAASYAFVDRGAFLPRAPARMFLLAGAVLFGIQISGVFFSLVLTRDATLVNVLYTSRSVWSVAAAWAGGWLFGLRDREAGTQVMVRRLLGAILLFAAIVLILW